MFIFSTSLLYNCLNIYLYNLIEGDYMVGNFIEEFLKKKRKRGYQIIGKGKFIFFIFSLLSTFVSFAVFLIYENLETGLLLITGMILILFSTRGVEKRINIASKEFDMQEKQLIKYWLKRTYNFTKASQYKEFSTLLFEEAKDYKWNFNFSSLIILFVPIWSAITVTYIREDPNILLMIIFIAVLITFLGIFINYSLKGLLEVFFDVKYNRIKKLAKLISEISIELSTIENKD
jgi:hypothetical protein